MKGSSTAVVIKGLFSTLQLQELCCILRKTSSPKSFKCRSKKVQCSSPDKKNKMVINIIIHLMVAKSVCKL